MKLIYYTNYKQKMRKFKDNQNKRRIQQREQWIKNRNKIDDIPNYNSANNSPNKGRIRVGNYRVLTYTKGDIVLLVDFFLRGDLPNNYLDYKHAEIATDSEFEEYIKRNTPQDTIEKIDLNNYKTILNLPQDDAREICFESSYFSQQTEEMDTQKLKKLFLLFRDVILDNIPSEIQKPYNTIYRASSGDTRIIYKDFSHETTTIKYIINSDDCLDLKPKELEKIDAIKSQEELIKIAKKAYPLEIFLDDADDWIEYIVKNSQGNIALSPEEEDILIKLKSYSYKEKFPFFINGRAGSGKSTILQYLFSDYVVEFLSLRQQGKELKYKPIYLTYNQKLKNKAIDNVSSIILAKSKNDLRDKLNLKDKDVITRQISEFFNSFEVEESSNFLEDLIIKNGKTSNLFQKRRITYPEIRAYFKKIIDKGNKGKFTPELIWYVIRSFIKGRGVISSDGKLEPLDLDGYKSLSREIKTVSENTFRNIFDNFYPSYKKYLQENNLYDDLDLIFEVFRYDAFDTKYSVIFCDEAQDFTRIEFDMILNLNIFLSDNIEINNLNYSNIPIVFAGDPFQTINPTGFSFEYLKALVYESYFEKSGTHQKLNEKELKFNYRSRDDIIKFSNLVQILRGILFNNKAITLQTEWLNNSNNLGNGVIYYSYDELDNIKDYISKSYYRFIFPTKNMSDEIFQNDKLIREIDPEIITPIDIKGLEDNWVVIYKFGEFFINNYNNLERYLNGGFSSREEALPYEYFLNNFYVAITRAKVKLIIIDTKRARDEFWSQLDVQNLYDIFRTQNETIKSENLLGFAEGSEDDLRQNTTQEKLWTKDRIKNDLFERYDDNSSDKFKILDSVDKIIQKEKFHTSYSDIIKAYRAEIEKNCQGYKNATLLFIKAIENANGEFAKTELNYLLERAFKSFWNFVGSQCKREEALEILIDKKRSFKALQFEYKKKIILLKRYLEENYEEALKDFRVEFTPQELLRDSVTKSILVDILKKLDGATLYNHTIELYKRNFINENTIIEIVESKKVDKRLDNYETLLRLLEIKNIKKGHKELYCEINLFVNRKDIECLVYQNKIDKVLKLLKSNPKVYKEAIKPYYKQILSYLATNSQRFDVLDDFGHLVDNYKTFYKDLDISIWEYIAKKSIEEKLIIGKVMSIFQKFRKEKDYKAQREHIDILVPLIQNRTSPVISRDLFNDLITIFSGIKDYPVCEMVTTLEKSMSIRSGEDIEKILKFYKYKIFKEGTRNDKLLLLSRYLNIAFKYDLKGKREFEESNLSSKMSWLEYLLSKWIKIFGKIELKERSLKRVPVRLNKKLCEIGLKANTIESLHLKIIAQMDKEKETKKGKISKDMATFTTKKDKNGDNKEVLAEDKPKNSLKDLALKEDQKSDKNNKKKRLKNIKNKKFSTPKSDTKEYKELKQKEKYKKHKKLSKKGKKAEEKLNKSISKTIKSLKKIRELIKNKDINSKNDLIAIRKKMRDLRGKSEDISDIIDNLL